MYRTSQEKSASEVPQAGLMGEEEDAVQRCSRGDGAGISYSCRLLVYQAMRP
jgi:hypothetical protein